MSGRHAQYVVVEQTHSYVIIQDTGTSSHISVTNDAEYVVEQIVRYGYLHGGKRLYYYDSMHQLDELVVVAGKFAGFKAGGPVK